MKIFSKVYRSKRIYQIINLQDVSKLKVTKLNSKVLFEKGIIKKENIPVKVLGKGDFDKKMEFSFDMFSKSAVEKIENAGGKVIFI